MIATVELRRRQSLTDVASMRPPKAMRAERLRRGRK
jgi:hypothetical protein